MEPSVDMEQPSVVHQFPNRVEYCCCCGTPRLDDVFALQVAEWKQAPFVDAHERVLAAHVVVVFETLQQCAREWSHTVFPNLKFESWSDRRIPNPLRQLQHTTRFLNDVYPAYLAGGLRYWLDGYLCQQRYTRSALCLSDCIVLPEAAEHRQERQLRMRITILDALRCIYNELCALPHPFIPQDRTHMQNAAGALLEKRRVLYAELCHTAHGTFCGQ